MALTRNPTSVWIVRREGKRGTAYRLRWIDPRTGRWASEACGRDLAYARTRRDRLKQELREGLSGKCPTASIAELIERLPALMAGRSANTIGKTKESLRLLDALTGAKVLAAVDRGAVMAFRSKRLEGEAAPATANEDVRQTGAAPATVNKDLRQIRSALSYAVDGGLLRENPLLRWKGMMLRETEKQVRVVEENEFAALLKACDNPALKGLLEVGYRQGLRRNELINLRWAAVDLDRRILHVVNVPSEGEFTKSRKNRSLPLHPLAHAALSALLAAASKRLEGGKVVPTTPHVFTWSDGRAICPDWLSHEFERLRKAAGLAKCTLHDLRRSFSTLAQRAGVDRSIVKDLGGWSAISVVEKHYSGSISAAYRLAMDQIVKSQTA